MIELVLLNAENFHDQAKTMPVPVIAFSFCFEEGIDILAIYEDEREAA